MSLPLLGVGLAINATAKGVSAVVEKVTGLWQKMGDAVTNFRKTSEGTLSADEKMYEGLLRGRQAAEGFGRGIGDAGQQMSDAFKKTGITEMFAVDDEIQHLSKTIGYTLPDKARRGTEKFKRSADSMSGLEHEIGRGLSDIEEGVGNLDKSLKVNKLQTWLQAISVQKLGNIASGIAHVGTAGGQLTTSFEAQAQAASVSARKVVAAQGIFGKALDKTSAKAAGMSLGMKISAETAGNAAAAVELFGSDLKAFGIDSAVTAAKLEDSIGVSVKDLGLNVNRLRKQFHLQDKDLTDVERSFTATGEAIHDMAGPLQHMPELMDLARQRASLMARGIKTIGAKDTILSVNSATNALFDLTGDVKGSQEAAMQLEKVMGESLDQFSNMFGGVGDDLHKFLENMSITTGDVKSAFQAAQQGPDAFIKKFSTIALRIKQKGGKVSDFFRLMGAQMSEVLGPDLTQTLITAFDSVDEQKLKLMSTTKAVGKDLKTVAQESWRSSMTMQEGFDLMMGSMEARFRDIGRGAAVKFVQNTKVAFGKFNDAAARLVKQGGPLGMIVEKMSEMSSLGAKALLPEALQPMVAIFSHLSPNVFESVKAFGALLPILGSLISPIGILAAALGGVYLWFKQLTAQYSDVGPMWEDNGKQMDKLNKKLSHLAEGTTDYNETLAKLQELSKKQEGLIPLKTLSDQVKGTDKVIAGLDKQKKHLKGNVDMYDHATFELNKLRKEQEQLAAGATTGGQSKADKARLSTLSTQISYYGTLQKRYAKDKQASMDADAAILANKKKLQGQQDDLDKEAQKHAQEEMQKEIDGWIAKAEEFVKRLGPVIDLAWPVVWDSLKKVFGKVFDFVATKVGEVLVMAVEGWGMIFSDAWKAFKAWANNQGDQMRKYWKDVFDSVVADLKTVANDIWAVLTWPFNAVNDLVMKLFGHSDVPDAIEHGVEEIEKIFGGFWTFVKGIFDDMLSLAGKVFEPITKIVSKIFGDGSDSAPKLIKGGMAEAVAIMQDATKQVTDMVAKSFYDAVATGLADAFKDGLKRASDIITDWMKSDLDVWNQYILKLFNKFRDMWNAVRQESYDAMTKVTDIALQAAAAVSSVQASLGSIRAQKAQIEAENPQPHDKPTETGKNLDDLFMAINRPDWVGGQGATTTLADMMSDLTTEVRAVKEAIVRFGIARSSGQAVTGPGTRQAASNLDTAFNKPAPITR